MVKRFQNRIAESRSSFPVAALLCTLLWGLIGWDNYSMRISYVAVAIATLLMVEFNNANVLIRIYSRMVSCTFLVLMTMSTFNLQDYGIAIVSMCCIGHYLASFRSYQDKNAVGCIFYAYLCLGIASIFNVNILYMLPLFLIVQRTNLLAFSFRILCSALLGLICPYWFLTAYCVAFGKLHFLTHHFAPLVQFCEVGDFTLLSLSQTVCVAFVFVLAIIGAIHFLRNSSSDKIRTRMLYEMFIIVDVFSFTILAIQPRLFNPLYGIIVINTSPLIAHFIALTHTRWSNIMTIIIILLSVVITIFSAWII